MADAQKGKPDPSQTPPVQDPKKTKKRKEVESSERIEGLRKRLYQRGTGSVSRERHPLEAVPLNRKVARSWHPPVPRDTQPSASQAPSPSPTKPQAEAPAPAAEPSSPFTMPKQKKRPYRLKLILAGIIFFIGALALSSMFLFFGNNMISGSNISIDVTGPFAARGGEKLELEVSVSNQNAIPIEAATLIIDYPPGTQSATEPGKELFNDRRLLTNLNPNEVVKVPLEAVVFGEENEEKMISIAVEYRVKGSNATFFKEAEPFRFKISSSPVVLNIEGVERISSGQGTEIILTAVSNSPTPLTNVLVKATYPFGFDFSSAIPSTSAGQDTWLIPVLEPEEEFEISIKGIVVGKETEEKVFSFSAGVPNERDGYSLASVFVNATKEIEVEQPFLGITVLVNESGSETVPVTSGQPARVRIEYKNTLEDTIHDAVIEVGLSGNAVDQFEVNARDGFYNSSANTIRWDRGDLEPLAEILPGRDRTVTFSLTPKEGVARTPEVRLDVTVSGQRVSESNVPQTLVGTASRMVRVESVTTLTSSVLYSDGPFDNDGPVPPVVGEDTEYALGLKIQNGSNDVAGAEVTAVLPQYVEWLDRVTPSDTVTYNPVTRTMTWKIGDLDAGALEDAWVQVKMLPSASQVDTAPVLMETQRFRATDRFTGSVVRSQASSVTTELFDDPEYEPFDGRVQTD